MNVSRNAVTMVAAVLCTVATISAQFAPQNARLNGLGGTFIMDDMNDILRYSAYMDQYKDGGQATFIGPILGVKAIGDVLSVGVVANRGLLLNTDVRNVFYRNGSFALTSSDSGLVAQNVPHLLLCANLSAVTIGIDAFYEYASARTHHETTTNPSVISDTSQWIEHIGAIASARFGGEEMPITAKFGFGRPMIHGKYTLDTAETEVTSDFGRFITFGGEVGLPAGDFQLTLGVDWNFEGYAFSMDGATPTTEFHNNRLANYIGLQGELFTDAKWGAQYTMYVYNGKTITPTDTSKNRELRQVLSCGIENTWKSVWIFDEAFARGGLNFRMSTLIDYARNAVEESRTRHPTSYNTVVPTIGAGVKKTIFQLDVTLNPTAWAGLVAGPAVGTVTLSLMF